MTKRLTNTVFVLLLITLAAANVMLIRQNLQMRRALEKYQPQSLKIGDTVPSFSATGLSGEAVNVNYNGSGPQTVVLFFTPTCPFCRQQFAYWREILGRTDKTNFQVIGLVDQAEDKARLEEYLRTMGCSQDSQTPLRIALIPKDVRDSYRLNATPITLVVANDGTVTKAWAGKWEEVQTADASTVFGLSLTAH